MPSPDSHTDASTEQNDSVSAQARETGADDGVELIQPEDEGYTRDPETGELQPEVVYVERLEGHVKIIPPTGDEEERWLDPIRGEGDGGELTNAHIADIMNLKVVAPDLTERPDVPNSGVTEQWVEDNMPKPRQMGYAAALARVACDEELYDLLHGRVPESKEDLIAKIAAQPGVDMQSLNEDGQGNRGRRR